MKVSRVVLVALFAIAVFAAYVVGYTIGYKTGVARGFSKAAWNHSID